MPRNILLPSLAACCLILFTIPAEAQVRIGTGDVVGLYTQHCAVCHGTDYNNGLGGSLLDTWDHVTAQRSVEDIIRKGLPELEMQPYEGILTDEQIRSLAILIEEKRYQAAGEEASFPTQRSAEFQTELHNFKIQTLTTCPDGVFWAVEFLPDGSAVLTGFEGQLYLFKDGKLSVPITGLPEITRQGQGGLMDVGVHPDYADNGWIYLSYTEKFPENDGYFTTISRGRINNGQWIDNEIIYRTDPEFATKRGQHFGIRLVFQDGYLFFGIGDRGAQDQAQDLTRPNGKIHRIHDDGRIPDDNPFRDTPNAYPTLWSYGNRNPQGLTLHPETGALWESEHGPRGGDEINMIEPGKNYGWPVITYGMNYNGTPITSLTEKEGMEQPATHFTPSIAICGTDFYTGDRFPKWQNHLFTGGLAAQELWRLETSGNQVTHRELILKNQGRIRDVRVGPDGFLYLILNKGRRSGESHLCRLLPE